MIIQILGLPGAGKTTLAEAIVDRGNAIHLNADYVRTTVNSDLGFTLKDRVEHARRLGEIARMLSGQNQLVVVDFVCPTQETREAFGVADVVIWVNRIQQSRFEDTNAMWETPTHADYVLEGDYDVTTTAIFILSERGIPDWKQPTTLMLGRYQPWHEGHHALLEKAHERTEQVVIGVRDTYGTSEKDPLSYDEVANRIRAEEWSSFVMKMPNITNIVYGRDVGYKIEQIDLGTEIHSISATQKRKDMGL